MVERQTRVAERSSDFFRLKFITACLVAGAVPTRLRIGEGFALNVSTTYRLRFTVLHTNVTKLKALLTHR